MQSLTLMRVHGSIEIDVIVLSPREHTRTEGNGHAAAPDSSDQTRGDSSATVGFGLGNGFCQFNCRSTIEFQHLGNHQGLSKLLVAGRNRAGPPGFFESDRPDELYGWQPQYKADFLLANSREYDLHEQLAVGKRFCCTQRSKFECLLRRLDFLGDTTCWIVARFPE